MIVNKVHKATSQEVLLMMGLWVLTFLSFNLMIDSWVAELDIVVTICVDIDIYDKEKWIIKNIEGALPSGMHVKSIWRVALNASCNGQ